MNVVQKHQTKCKKVVATFNENFCEPLTIDCFQNLWVGFNRMCSNKIERPIWHILLQM